MTDTAASMMLDRMLEKTPSGKDNSWKSAILAKILSLVRGSGLVTAYTEKEAKATKKGVEEKTRKLKDPLYCKEALLAAS